MREVGGGGRGNEGEGGRGMEGEVGNGERGGEDGGRQRDVRKKGDVVSSADCLCS